MNRSGMLDDGGWAPATSPETRIVSRMDNPFFVKMNKDWVNPGSLPGLT